jgi:biopolymer transport protein ExbD
MGMTVGSGSEDGIMDINVVPLIDVMLVLLIMFIITLPIMTHAVKLDMPQAADPPPDAVRPEVVQLEIDFDGTVIWNGTVVQNLQVLEGYFQVEARRDPQPEIHLRPDRRVMYNYVAQVLAAAQRNRMERIGFVNTGEFRD